VQLLQPEATQCLAPDVAVRLELWAEVVTRGYQMVADGVITEAQRAQAEADYRAWIRDSMVSQSLYLVAVEGRRPV
jgi:hypothetical protein